MKQVNINELEEIFISLFAIFSIISFCVIRKETEFFFNYWHSLFLFFFIVFFISILVRRLFALSAPLYFKFFKKSQKKILGTAPLSDAPIKTHENDLLGRSKFVEDLCDLIDSCPTNSESIRICLNAKWGEGKTSIFNLLKEKIEENKKTDICFYDFNPWHYFDKEKALEALLYGLGETISAQYPYPSTSNTSKELINVISQNITGFKLQNFFTERPTLKNSISKLSDSIKKTGKKYIIFIDDVDRLDKESLKNTLKCIMALSELKGLIFILAGDISYINGILEENVFSEKILTYVFDLPKIQEEDMKNYFNSKMEEIYKELKVERKANEMEFDFEYQKIFQLSKFNNIRNVKRIISTLKLYYRNLHGEVNAADLLRVVYLSLFYPKVHNDIWINSDMYMNFSNKNLDGNETQSFFATLLKDYKKEEQKDLAEILSHMTPTFLHKDGSKSFYPYEHKKSFHDERYFAKYFLFKCPDNDISDTLIDSSLKLWESKENPKPDIKEFIIREKDKIEKFFIKLEDRQIEINLMMDIISAYSESEICKKLNISILDLLFSRISNEKYKEQKEKTDKEKKDFIIQIIEKASNLDFAEAIAVAADYHYKEPERNYIYDFQKILSKRIDNMRPEKVLENISLDLFRSYIGGFLLEHSVKTTTINERKENILQKKFLSAILSNKNFVFKFIITRTTIDSTEGRLFDFKNLIDFYGEENIKKGISTMQQDNTLLNLEEKKELTEFKKAYERYKETIRTIL